MLVWNTNRTSYRLGDRARFTNVLLENQITPGQGSLKSASTRSRRRRFSGLPAMLCDTGSVTEALGARRVGRSQFTGQEWRSLLTGALDR